MTTKSDILSSTDKLQTFGFDSRYANINLNQTYKCSNISLIQSYSKSISGNNKHFSRKNQKHSRKGCSIQVSDPIFDNVPQKEKVTPGKKSINNASESLNHCIESDKVEKRWKNKRNLNAKNNSTLSLHISAYENSAKTSNSDSTKIVKVGKKSFNFSSKVQNSFEFPRQREEEEDTVPEIAQFRASQRLLNPNNTPNYNYEDMERALNETSLTLGVDDDMISQISSIQNSFVNTRLNRTVTFDQSVDARCLDDTRLTLGLEYDFRSEASTIERQSNIPSIFDHSSIFERSHFNFGDTLEILEADNDVEYEAPAIEEQPYVRPSFIPSTNSETRNFGGFECYEKKPPFAFFTKGGSLTVNTTNVKPPPPFKGRCYSTSGHSISGKSVAEMSFNETGDTTTSDTSFLGWGSRRQKSARPPTGEPSRAPPGFVPKVRGLSKIHEDDLKSAKEYEKIYEFEESLIVHGVSNLITIDDWETTGFPKVLLQNISNSMYLKPRQIQRVAMPLILDNLDILCCNETGSGKTAAFLIPIIAMCMQSKAEGTFISEARTPFAVIIGPTRELIHQNFEQALKFTQNTGVTVAKLYGEYAVRSNAREIQNGCDLLFTTPGRLHHFVNDDLLYLKYINFLVFDEGDTILGKDFLDDIDPVLRHRNFARRGYYQTLFFSATFGEYMIRAATRYMRRNNSASILSKKCSTNKLCMQDFQRVLKDNRLEALKEFLDLKMAEVDMNPTKLPRILIFVNSQRLCDELTEQLRTFGFSVIGIRGNYAQDRRLHAFESFRDKRYPILVSTDLCAKGIDIKDVDLVLNYELPYYVDSYIYRVGRVGRIREGQCLSFVDPDLNKFVVMKILQVLQVANHPVSSNLDEIVEEAQRFIDEGEDPSAGFDVFFGDDPAPAPQGLNPF